MLQQPHIDPVAFSIGPFFGYGPLQVHWYGIMYLVAFATAWWLGNQRGDRLYQLAKQNNPNYHEAANDAVHGEHSGGQKKDKKGAKNKNKKAQSEAQTSQLPSAKDIVADLIFWGMMGVVIGGRIGYVLFYNFDKFLADPMMLIRVWEGGMSFHGGLIGVMTFMYFYAKKLHIPYFAVTDFVVSVAPLGLAAGRFGNFINGELWGKTTDLPWGMVFRNAGDGLPHHPSQLYEMFFEGFLLFTIVWLFSRKPRPIMATSGVFALCYGVFRFGLEFIRLPDAQLGYLAFGWLTMGQILSLPLIITGIVLLWLAYRKPGQNHSETPSQGKKDSEVDNSPNSGVSDSLSTNA